MIIIKENNKYSRSDWIERLAICQSDFQFLLDNGIFKIDFSGESKLYRNRFVGFIALSNDIIFSQPKFIEDENDIDFKYLISIFQQYNSRKNRNKTIKTYNYYGLADINYKETLFEYNIYQSLLKYYQSFGVYTVENHSYNQNTNRRISWNRTVSVGTPIHMQNSVYYDNPIGIEIYDDNNLISSLHVSIFKYLIEKYSLGSFKLNINSFEKYTQVSISDIQSNASTWNSIIQDELSKTYLQHNIHLLNLLSLFINKISEQNSIRYDFNKQSLYGTISFHNIWEDACAQVFCSQYDTLKELIAQPFWDFPEIAYTKESLGQIPDSLHETNSHIFVLDAKYYYPIPQSLCGWGDLVKQYFYAKSIKNTQNKEIVNALLFPGYNTLDKSIHYSGSVDMKREGQVEESFPPIKVYKLNPFFLLDNYIKNIENPDLVLEFIGQ